MTPLVPIAQPLVKWAVEVSRLQDLPRIVHRAAKVAMTPPTGPVFISLPGDILNEQDALELGQPTRVETAGRPRRRGAQPPSGPADRGATPSHPGAGHEIATADALGRSGGICRVARRSGVSADGVRWRPLSSPSIRPSWVHSLVNSEQVRETLSPYDLMFCIGSDVLRMSVFSETDPMPDGLARGPARSPRLGDGEELPGGNRVAGRCEGNPRRSGQS